MSKLDKEALESLDSMRELMDNADARFLNNKLSVHWIEWLRKLAKI